MSSSIQAVDLDAVLDAFESSQDLVQENENKLSNVKEEETIKSEPILKPNLLEDINGDSTAPQTSSICQVCRNLQFKFTSKYSTALRIEFLEFPG